MSDKSQSPVSLTKIPLKEKIKAAVVILLCICIIVMAAVIKNQSIKIDYLNALLNPAETEHDNDLPDIEVSLIVGELKSAAELSTAEMSYTGVLHYEDGKFLAKKAFYLIYQADVRAGIDFEKFNSENVTVTDTTITVTLPHVEIFDINIKEDELVTIDEKKSIFNPESKDDLQKALVDAKADLDMNLDEKELLTKATQEAKIFIEKFLRPYIGDRELDIKFQ